MTHGPNKSIPVDHTQTKTEIEQVLRAAGVRPRTRWGQHFLIDGNLMRRVADTAGISAGDRVIEIGAGTGGLTDLLVRRANQVVSVEMDSHLLQLLVDRFADTTNLTLIEGDALAGKHRLHPRLEQMLTESAVSGGARDAGRGTNHAVLLVANLPYHIATPLILNLLLDHPVVARLVFTIQAEVADRFLASPGTKAYGPISIVSQLLCRVVMVTRIPREAFWPRPAVGSALMKFDRVESPFSCANQANRFAALLRGVFVHRRKTLRTALRRALPADLCALMIARYDTRRRPGSFSCAEWLEMFLMLEREASGGAPHAAPV